MTQLQTSPQKRGFLDRIKGGITTIKTAREDKKKSKAEQQYNDLLPKAKDALVMLKQEVAGAFWKPLADAIWAAEQNAGLQPPKWPEAAAAIANYATLVKTAKSDAKKAADKIAADKKTYETKLGKAQTALTELDKVDEADPAPLRRLIDLAAGHAGKNPPAYELASQTLEGYSDLFSQAKAAAKLKQEEKKQQAKEKTAFEKTSQKVQESGQKDQEKLTKEWNTLLKTAMETFRGLEKDSKPRLVVGSLIKEAAALTTQTPPRYSLAIEKLTPYKDVLKKAQEELKQATDDVKKQDDDKKAFDKLLPKAEGALKKFDQTGLNGNPLDSLIKKAQDLYDQKDYTQAHATLKTYDALVKEIKSQAKSQEKVEKDSAALQKEYLALRPKAEKAYQDLEQISALYAGRLKGVLDTSAGLAAKLSWAEALKSLKTYTSLDKEAREAVKVDKNIPKARQKYLALLQKVKVSRKDLAKVSGANLGPIDELLRNAEAFTQGENASYGMALAELKRHEAATKEGMKGGDLKTKYDTDLLAAKKAIVDLAGADTTELKALVDMAVSLAPPNSPDYAAALSKIKTYSTLVKRIQAAAEKKGEERGADLDILPKYLKKKADLEDAIKELQNYPGTEAARNELALMLSKADQLAAGQNYAAAKEALTGSRRLVAKAKKESKGRMKAMPENVQELFTAASRALDSLRSLGTEGDAAPFQKRLDEQAALGRDAVVKKVLDLTNEVYARVQTLSDLRKECETTIKGLKVKLERAAQELPDTMAADFTRQFQMAQSRMGLGLYERAKTRLEALEKKLDKNLANAGNDKNAWNNAKNQRDGFRQRVEPMRDFPLTSKLAFQIREAIADLETRVPTERIYRQGVAELASIQTRVEQLQGTFNPYQDFAAKRAGFDRDVKSVAAEVEKELKTLTNAMKGQVQGSYFGQHGVDLGLILADWADNLDTALNENDLKVGAIKQRLADLQTRIRDTHSQPQALEQFVKEGKKDEENGAYNGLVNEITVQLNRLRDDGYTKEATHRQTLETIKGDKANGTAPKDLLDRLTSLKGEVGTEVQAANKALEKAKAEAVQRKEFVLKEIQRVQADLGKTFPKGLKWLESSVGKKVPGFFDALTLEAEDLQAVIDTPDLATVKTAITDLDALADRLAKLESDAKSKDPKVANFTQVMEKSAKLPKRLKNKVLMKRMSKERAALRDEVIQVLVKVKKVPPEEGLKLLNDIDARITKLKNDSKDVQKKHDEFKLLRNKAIEEAKELRDALAEGSKTDVIKNRVVTPKYVEDLLQRIGDINQTEHASVENIDAAKAAIEGIRQEIALAKSNPDELRAREEKAKQVSVEYENDLKLWHQENTSFKEVELARAEAAVAAAGEDGDPDQLEDLKKAYKRAKDTAKKVKDLKTARKMLQEAKEKAAKIASNPLGAKIVGRNNLPRVQALWRTAVDHFSKGVAELATKVKDTTPNAPQELQDPLPKVLKALVRLSKWFNAAAFDQAVVVLTAKGGKEKTKKAAREGALRTVRQYKGYIDQDPLVKELLLAENVNLLHKVGTEISQMKSALTNLEYNIKTCV